MQSTELTFPQAISLVRPPALNIVLWTLIGTGLLCWAGPVKLGWAGGIPITLQSLVLLLLPMLWGTFSGSMACVGYLLLGGIGLPVFSSGAGGWQVFVGPSGGFLLSFLPAAFLVGKMVEARWGNHWFAWALALLVGHQVILLGGLPWLGWQKGWEVVLPTWAELTPGMLCKVAIGTLLVGATRWGLMKYNSRKNLSGTSG